MSRPITEHGAIVVVGFGAVGRKLREILEAVGERVVVVAPEEAPGVDIVGDVSDPSVVKRLSLHEARVAILALKKDSATIFAATVLRDLAPDLPILAGVASSDNAARIQRAGVDYVLSISQVAGQLLAHHVLGETVSIQSRIKLARVAAGRLAGKNPLAERIRERTGCTVVAVERVAEGAPAGASDPATESAPDLLMEFPESFRLTATDALYICGTSESLSRYEEVFPAEWL